MILYPSRKRKADNYGSLVKRLRRRPLTAETGVRFSYELFTKDKKLVLRFHAFVEQKKQKTIRQYGSLVKRLRRRPLTAETGVRFSYELFTKDKKLVLRFHTFVE